MEYTQTIPDLVTMTELRDVLRNTDYRQLATAIGELLASHEKLETSLVDALADNRRLRGAISAYRDAGPHFHSDIVLESETLDCPRCQAERVMFEALGA